MPETAADHASNDLNPLTRPCKLTITTKELDLATLQYSGSEGTFSASSRFSTFTSSGDKPFQHVPHDITKMLDRKGFEVDPWGTVTWREESSTHPRNWPLIQKCYDTALICFLEFFMTLVSNTGSSMADRTYSELKISRVTALMCFTLAYLSGQAIGGLILPPVSETFGGRTIYVLATVGFAFGNVLIGTFPKIPVVVTARFFTGFLSAMPSTVAIGSLENMWNARARIWTVHIWIAGAVVGLSLGPPAAVYIATSPLEWRWVFMFSAVVSSVSALFCLGMKESRPAQILRQEIQRIERQTGFVGLHADAADRSVDVKTFCQTSLLLPVRLFFTEPVVFLTSVMAATVYAVIYIFPEAFSIVYGQFGFDERQLSLVNLAVMVGVPFTFLPRIFDIQVSRKRQKHQEPEEPEDKILGFLVAAPVLAAAFWLFALTVPPLRSNISPWVSIASLVGIGFSTVEFDTVLSGYLADSYGSHAASANAPMSFLRAILSGVFPLFGGHMFSSLGSNHAMFILAGVATLYCGVALCFARYGKRIRQRSRFAQQASQPGAIEHRSAITGVA